jgi:hypothetical protein
MLTLDVAAWDIALRTTIVYLAVLVGLRLAGKREIGQMTVLDLVVRGWTRIHWRLPCANMAWPRYMM